MKKCYLTPIFNLFEMINYMVNIFELKSSTNSDAKLQEFMTKGLMNLDTSNNPNEILDEYILLPLEERFSKIYLEQEVKNTMSYYKDLIHDQIDGFLTICFNVDFSNQSRDHFCIFWAKHIVAQVFSFVDDIFNHHLSFLNQFAYQPLNIKELLEHDNAISYFFNWLDNNLDFNHEWPKYTQNKEHISRWKKGTTIPNRNNIFERYIDENETGLGLKEFLDTQITITDDHHKAKLLLILDDLFLICRAIDISIADVSILESNIDPNYPAEFRFKIIILSLLESIDDYFILIEKNKDLFGLGCDIANNNSILQENDKKLRHLLIDSQEKISDKNIIDIENALNQLEYELNKDKNNHHLINYHYYNSLYDIYRFNFKSGIEKLSVAYNLSLFTGHPFFADIFQKLIGLYSIYYLFISNSKLQKDFIEIRNAGLHKEDDLLYVELKITEMNCFFRIYVFKTDPYFNDLFFTSHQETQGNFSILEDSNISIYQKMFIEQFKYYKFENKKKYNHQITALFSYIKNYLEELEFYVPEGNIQIDFSKSKKNKIIIPTKNYSQLFYSMLISDRNAFKKLLDLGADINNLSFDSSNILILSLEKMQNFFGYNRSGKKEYFWFDSIKNNAFTIDTLCAITSQKRLTALGIAVNVGRLDIIKQLFKMYLVADPTIEGRSFFANQKFSTDLNSPLYKTIYMIDTIKNIDNSLVEYDVKTLEIMKKYVPNISTEVLNSYINVASNKEFFQVMHHINKHNTTLTELRNIAIFLLENGADPELIHHVNDSNQYTPFHMAIESDEKELVELMIEKYHVDYQKRIWIKNEVRGYEKQDNIFLALQWNAKRVLAYFQTLDWHHPPKSPTK